MQAEARVGAISASSGSVNPLRTNEEGALVTQCGGGKYYEATKNAQVYVVANQAAVALTALYATPYTGLLIANPPASTKNLVMLRFGYTFTVLAPTAATWIGLMTGSAPTTALVSTIDTRNRLKGGAAGVGIALDAAVLTGGIPVLEQVFGMYGTGATNLFTQGPFGDIDLDGSLILAPGYYVAACSFAANTASAEFSFMWQEVDA